MPRSRVPARAGRASASDEPEQQRAEERPVAEAVEEGLRRACWRARRRARRAAPAGRLRGDAAERIGDEGHAGIGGAQHRQAGLDGAQQRVVGVLGRADRAVEPLVVGDVEQELGLGRIGAEIARKDRLVADQRDEGRHARRASSAACRRRAPSHWCRARTGLMPKSFQKLGERQVFAERHEVRLVVAGDDLAVGVDGEQRIVAGVVGRDRRDRSRARAARR